MSTYMFCGSFIAVVALYVNTASLIKKASKNEDISNQTFIGSILCVFLLA